MYSYNSGNFYIIGVVISILQGLKTKILKNVITAISAIENLSVATYPCF